MKYLCSECFKIMKRPTKWGQGIVINPLEKWFFPCCSQKCVKKFIKKLKLLKKDGYRAFVDKHVKKYRQQQIIKSGILYG